MKDSPLSLFQLNNKVQKIIHDNLSEPFWIIAEISEIKINASGHCYLELIEKDEEKILARARGTIWSYTFRILKPYFQTSTGQQLSQGMKIMVQVIVEFHELYGYSVNIRDIDPSYTIGDLERQRRETIGKLEKEGVIHMNKELPLPEVIQKVAIVSSETAAGYEDFMNQLLRNQFGYTFYTKLFPAVMQGSEAVDSIIKALEKIYSFESLFDIVIIIRGGGAQADLNCFDDYWLAYNIAQFSLPVITGIGHEKDYSVADIVANISLKTPTAVAEYIINYNNEFEVNLIELQDRIVENSRHILSECSRTFEYLSNKISSKAQVFVIQEKERLTLSSEKIKNSSIKFVSGKDNQISISSNKIRNLSNTLFIKFSSGLEIKRNQLVNKVKPFFNQKKLVLTKHEDSIRLLDPENILDRGYSLTYKDQRIVKDARQLKLKDKVITRLKRGEIESEVVRVK